MQPAKVSNSSNRISGSASPACRQAPPIRLRRFWQWNVTANLRKTRTLFASAANGQESNVYRLLKMIRLYRIKRHTMLDEGILQQDTPFDPGFHEAVSFFSQHGIVFTEDPLHCDLFVVSHAFPPWWNSWKRKAQLLLRYQFRRHVLIWSHEPFNI